ncbi:DUF4232 domain-containing protein [Streptomyces sp. NPDC127068]|uniref:DUF4232 domain-containing protein n=1 Tax=Streptomyces sp. NPDC127068 TaxID=3347127 RepID=UPI0036678952
MSAIRGRPAPRCPAVTLLTLAGLAGLSGCGLSAELERERHPGGRPTKPAFGVASQAPPSTLAPLPGSRPPGTGTTSGASADVSAAPDGAPGGAPCDSPGIRLRAEHTGAAMGLRAMSVTLTNCDSEPYALDGHPRVRLVDEHGVQPPGIRVVGDLDVVPMAPSAAPATAFTLKRGESAVADVMWRTNAEHVPSLRIRARPDAPEVVVTPDDPLDVGPRNVVGTSPWRPR